MCVTVAKVSQGRPKNKHCIDHSAKYKRSSSSYWRAGRGTSKTTSRRFDLLRTSRSHIPSTVQNHFELYDCAR